MARRCARCLGKGNVYIDKKCPTCGGGGAVVYRQSSRETSTSRTKHPDLTDVSYLLRSWNDGAGAGCVWVLQRNRPGHP